MTTHPEGDKRTRIVDTAAKLAHEHGFNATSLADIARDSRVPLGNLYYYFKTKDAIGEALIERMASVRAVMREEWERSFEPRARIEAFVQSAIDRRDVLSRCGCPIGSLCTELQKSGGPLADQATKLFDEMLKWLEAQFRLLGKGAESRELAFHVVVVFQGAAVLANAFHNARQATRELSRLKDWVREV